MKNEYEIEIRGICGFGKHWSDDIPEGAEGAFFPPKDDKPADGGVTIGWAAKGIGFGELTIAFKDGKLVVDNEMMSREFCEAVLKALVVGIPAKVKR